MHSPAIAPRFRFGFLLAALVLILAPSLVHADETPTGVLAFTVTVPEGKLSTKEVHDVVISASIAREWSVKEDGTERVVIYINHRKNEATVTYLISDKSVQAYCEGYATDGKGTRKGPEQPSGWLSNLKKDITAGLNKAAFVNKS